MSKFTFHDHNHHQLHTFCHNRVSPYAYTQSNGTGVALYKTETVRLVIKDKIKHFKHSNSALHKSWVALWENYLQILDNIDKEKKQ